VDDDGDPIHPVTTGNPVCPWLSFAPGTTTAQVACALEHVSTATLRTFATAHALDVVAGDPWSRSAPERMTLTIGNSPPVVGGRVEIPTWAVQGACCEHDPEFPALCLAWRTGNTGGSVSQAPPALDPDGDPLDVTVVASDVAGATPQVSTCSARSCPGVTFTAPQVETTCGGGVPRDGTVLLQVSDGHRAATGTVLIDAVQVGIR
jgi:hypothetical protein